MKGYTTDQTVMQEHVDRYKGQHRPHIMELNKLKVILPDGTRVKIDGTPHYQYMIGNHEIYMAFLHKHYGQHAPFEQQLESLSILMNDDSNYLDEKFHDGFIMHNPDLILMDGAHRAARLAHLGIEIAPVLEYTGGAWDASRKSKI